jgi:hypothetical protein
MCDLKQHDRAPCPPETHPDPAAGGPAVHQGIRLSSWIIFTITAAVVATAVMHLMIRPVRSTWLCRPICLLPDHVPGGSLWGQIGIDLTMVQISPEGGF